MRRPAKYQRAWASLAAVLAVAGALPMACVSGPPSDPDNLCSIFAQKRGWYRAARESAARWGVPESVQLALIYQESRFDARARPPRKKFLGIIPGPRPSSAYGYGQILDGTWEEYRTDVGRDSASRDDFGDVVDFIGWYGDRAQRRAGVARNDARAVYLAYHEGIGGYSRGSHTAKPWLAKVARKVSRRAALYQTQYDGCRERLQRKRFLGIF
jgi:hypothetical protein